MLGADGIVATNAENHLDHGISVERIVAISLVNSHVSHAERCVALIMLAQPESRAGLPMSHRPFRLVIPTNHSLSRVENLSYVSLQEVTRTLIPGLATCRVIGSSHTRCGLSHFDIPASLGVPK